MTRTQRVVRRQVRQPRETLKYINISSSSAFVWPHLYHIELVSAVVCRADVCLPAESAGDVVLLCRQLVPGQTLVRQLRVVAPHGDSLLAHTGPVTVTLGAVKVPSQQVNKSLLGKGSKILGNDETTLLCGLKEEFRKILHDYL